MSKLRPVLVLALLLAAGCAGPQAQDGPLPPAPNSNPNAARVQGFVLAPDDTPVAQADVRLLRADGRFYATQSTSDGSYQLRIQPEPDCLLVASRSGFAPTHAATVCAQDVRLNLTLYPPAEATPTNRSPLAGWVRVFGTVRSLDTGGPLLRPTVTVLGAGLPGNATADLRGRYELFAPPVPGRVDALADCAGRSRAHVRPTHDMRLDFYLPAHTGLSKPAVRNLQATPGPGHGQITLTWDDPTPLAFCTGAAYYQILRGDSPTTLQPLIRIPSSRAFADSGRSPTQPSYYRVIPLSPNGVAGEPDLPIVSAQALGTGPPAHDVAPRTIQLSGYQAEYEAHAPDGSPVAPRAWRVVRGVGNCCELYLTTTATGRILDFGGTFLRYSDDAGITWQEIATPVPYLTGEGALVTAPNGDVVGVGWSPYTGDQLWAHKYSAADGKWTYQAIPVHGPVYDRPWLGVLKGPFLWDRGVTPYVVILRSGFGANSALTLMSGDGITYREAGPLLAADRTAAPATTSWPSWAGLDLDRDWTQAHVSARTVPITFGLGAYAPPTQSGCVPWSLVTTTLKFTCPGETFRPNATDRFVVDAYGLLHLVRRLADGFEYRMSADLGQTWSSLELALPDGFSPASWDFRAHALLGQGIIAVHAQPRNNDDPDRDLVFRVDIRDGQPRLREMLTVGKSDRASGSGLGSSQPRFDFMTVGLLPTGKIVVAFADAASGSPQLAVEL